MYRCTQWTINRTVDISATGQPRQSRNMEGWAVDTARSLVRRLRAPPSPAILAAPHFLAPLREGASRSVFRILIDVR